MNYHPNFSPKVEMFSGFQVIGHGIPNERTFFG